LQANPKLATIKDEDERLPIHWAVAFNHLPIVELLVAQKNFDPDVEVSLNSRIWLDGLLTLY
jgi:26S proteasome non-ATPase regulatory subunit 10